MNIDKKRESSQYIEATQAMDELFLQSPKRSLNKSKGKETETETENNNNNNNNNNNKSVSDKDDDIENRQVVKKRKWITIREFVVYLKLLVEIK